MLCKRKSLVEIQAHRADRDFSILCDYGRVRGKAGWFIVDDNGILDAYPPDRFAEYFEVIGGQDDPVPKIQAMIESGHQY